MKSRRSLSTGFQIDSGAEEIEKLTGVLLGEQVLGLGLIVEVEFGYSRKFAEQGPNERMS